MICILTSILCFIMAFMVLLELIDYFLYCIGYWDEQVHGRTSDGIPFSYPKHWR